MHLARTPCPLPYVQMTPPRDFPLPTCRSRGAFPPAASFTLTKSPRSVSWIPAREVFESGQMRCAVGSRRVCLASTQSSKRPKAATERPFWRSILPRPLIYSSKFSDVDPVQLSDLWLLTLQVRRDPEKIVKAMRHSFAFVVVLAEDEDDAPSSAGSGLKTGLKTVGVGRAVSDGTFIATLCDVAVHPAYRHRGIGRRVVKKLVEKIKRIGGPSGFAVFPPPPARRFFWMIGFRSDRKYKLMAYRGKSNDETTEADGRRSSDTLARLVETEYE